MTNRTRHHNDAPERGWRCAMRLTQRIVGIKKSLTLTEACARFGVAGGTHRAAEDVRATYRLLRTITSMAA